ncbi:MAG: translation initiation factor IF-2 [Terracidiphilus sp.]|nr:translation initiation factor IF-2 [Terracidiphilus sp.]
MSKVRINDLAREMEVKSKQILDILAELGLATGKTHSSSLEADEAEKVRVHFHRNDSPASHAGSGAARHTQGIAPKIDLSHISKPGDVLKAILAKKKEEEEQARLAHAPKRTVAVTPPPAPAAAAPVPPPVVAVPSARPEPRRIVPQPRQAPPIVHQPAAPAIASRPPAVAVVAKPPAATAAAPARPVVVVAPPPATVVAVKPPVQPPTVVVAPPPAKEEPVQTAEKPAAPVKQATHHTPAAPAAPAIVPVAPAPAPEPAVQAAEPAAPAHTPAPEAKHAPAAAAPVAPAAAAPAAQPHAHAAHTAHAAGPHAAGSHAPAAPGAPAKPAPPARRMVMPQTGPRPVYKAPPPPPGQPPVAPNAAAGLQRGRPIFDRRPSGPGSYQQRTPGAPGQFPGGPRPKHPTRTTPGGFTPGGPGSRPGFGQRPGFGAPRPGGFGGPRPSGPGGAPPPEAGRPQRAPSRGRGRGQQQYPKTKEGPMKGFVPPPRYGGQSYSNEPLPITREITVTEGISVKDLAEKLDVRAKDLIATLLMRGLMVTVNQSLDSEMVKDVAAHFGAKATVISYEEELENEAIEEVLDNDNTDVVEVPRAPVVTVMGHVDHGKTSLLDAIRETDVVSGEAGGITQHIGAYKVKFTKEGSPASGREIVFLDTPGHEAFTRMRARGAKVTDIVVIVVAADDGVMPQTIEAIDHAKAADVPIIVAVNKIDKPEANPDRVKKQLADRGLIPEEWAGAGQDSTVFVEVSAKKRLNLDLLLEMICLVSDIKAPKATPGRKAVGSVIEAKLDRGRGAVASVLVQDGTLHLNDSYIVGNTFGKVRAMFDDRGRAIEEAGPSTPVEVLGLESIPDAGDTFLVVGDRDKAKGIATYRKMKEREAQLSKSSRVSLEGLAEQIRLAGVKDLALIIKGDVTGSVEVLADSLVNMSTEKVRIKVIRSGVGSITESDILLAAASNAIVIGFNVRPERKGADLAQQENVDIRLHSIIYELQDEIQKAMFGMLEPVFKENYLGRAEVLNVFHIPKVGTIAGCSVKDGVIRRDAEIKVMRGSEQVFKGKVVSLKRFKDDAKEVTNGMECGIGLSGFGNDLKTGDVIEAFTTEKLAADLGALTSAKA